MPTAQEILKQYFGYDSFRPGQDELVQAILSGRDTLGIMPTGAGKSICYQVPALALPGLTLVISPLISLMKDQVGALNEAGVPAACINSALSFEEMRDALYFAGRGQYKLLYVAPERLTAPFFLDFARRVPISMVTVDEAHCISQWGQDFRPSYLKILDFLAALPQRPLVSAFTATATAEVRDDIIRALGLEDPFVITTGFDRPNLYFAVEKPSSKPSALLARLLRRREPPVDLDHNGAELIERKLGNDPLRAVARQDRDPAALAHAEVPQIVRRLVDVALQVAIGQPPVLVYNGLALRAARERIIHERAKAAAP